MTFLVISWGGRRPERGWVRFHQGQPRLTSPAKVIRVLGAQLRFVHSRTQLLKRSLSPFYWKKHRRHTGLGWAGLGRKAKFSRGGDGPPFPPQGSVPPRPRPDLCPWALCHPLLFTNPHWAAHTEVRVAQRQTSLEGPWQGSSSAWQSWGDGPQPSCGKSLGAGARSAGLGGSVGIWLWKLRNSE